MGMRSFYFLMAKRFNLEMYIFVLILFVFRKQGRKNSAAASFQTERRRPSSCTTSTQKRAMQPAGCASKTTRATSSSIALQADHQENESSFTKITSLFQPSSRTTIHKVCLSFSPKQRNKQYSIFTFFYYCNHSSQCCFQFNLFYITCCKEMFLIKSYFYTILILVYVSKKQSFPLDGDGKWEGRR